MNFKSNYFIFNGTVLTLEEAKRTWKQAFNYNLVTVLIPDGHGEYNFYPSLNPITPKNSYYADLGHAACFQKINELLKRDVPSYYVSQKFENVQNRYMIANMFLEKGMGIVMRTTPNKFIVIFPALSNDREILIGTCNYILKLIDILDIDNGCLQINGIIYDNIDNFKEYCNSLMQNNEIGMKRAK